MLFELFISVNVFLQQQQKNTYVLFLHLYKFTLKI